MISLRPDLLYLSQPVSLSHSSGTSISSPDSCRVSQAGPVLAMETIHCCTHACFAALEIDNSACGVCVLSQLLQQALPEAAALCRQCTRGRTCRRARRRRPG